MFGIRQKNGYPGHPQTQGKIERFHQTLKRWLAARRTARSPAELQQQLNEFREHYNEQRPHRALDRHTPGQAYRAIPKALPAAGRAPTHYRTGYDRLDTKGKMSVRRAGRMHYLGVGTAHARTEIARVAERADELLAAQPAQEALNLWIDEFLTFLQAKQGGMASVFRAVMADGENPFIDLRALTRVAAERLLTAVAEKNDADVNVDPNDVLVALHGISLATSDPDQTRRLTSLLLAGLRNAT